MGGEIKLQNHKVPWISHSIACTRAVTEPASVTCSLGFLWISEPAGDKKKNTWLRVVGKLLWGKKQVGEVKGNLNKLVTEKWCLSKQLQVEFSLVTKSAFHIQR